LSALLGTFAPNFSGWLKVGQLVVETSQMTRLLGWQAADQAAVLVMDGTGKSLQFQDPSLNRAICT